MKEYLIKNLYPFFRRHNTHALTAFILLICITSCKRDVSEDCPNCPHVTAVIPNAAYPADTVLVIGKHLLPNPDYNDMLQVTFNGNLIPDDYIIETTADSVRLIIPRGTQTGPVTVDINVQDELLCAQPGYFTYLPLSNVTTYAGNGDPDTMSATNPLDAKFNRPRLITYDPVLKSVFSVEDNSAYNKSLIRKIDSTGNVSTLGVTSLYIRAIASDNGGQKYVAAGSDFVNKNACKIYRLSNAGILTLWANNSTCGYLDNTTPASARFSDVRSITFDESNNLYITDANRIRKIDITANLVTTIAGTGVAGFRNGQADSAKFSFPNSIAVENDGTIYISDGGNNVVRKLSAGLVSTVAGVQSTVPNFTQTGTALSSYLSNPRIVLSDNEGHIYILEGGFNCIRQIIPTGNSIKIFAGHYSYPGFTDGAPLTARFNNPSSMAYDKVTRTLYIADTGSNKIRKISFE